MSTLEQMVSARTQKSVLVVVLLLCASVIAILFPSSVYADHVTPNPCAIGELDIEPRGVDIAVGKLGSKSGKVPVYDEWVIRNLISLATAMQKSAEFSELQDQDIQRTRDYLRLLCEKEYNFDHTVQHEWALVIDKFVLDTIRWVQTVYNNNPIFVTNQSVYYKLVDKGVFNTFLYEIAFSNIGEENKRTILVALIEDKIRNRFPYGVGVLFVAGAELAPDGLVEELRETFSEDLFNKLRLEDFNVPELAQIAQAELSRRTAEIRENEANKLNWGRGFFSYEICDFSGFGYVLNTDAGTVLQTIPGDRRNCRVVTPGSLIQDQVSFVLGSALRQMELADEVDEWVSGNAALVLRNVLGDFGLNLDNNLRGLDGFVYRDPQALGPSVVGADIELFLKEGLDRGETLLGKRPPVGGDSVRANAEGKFDPRVEIDFGLDYLYPLEFQTVQQLWPAGGIVDEIPDLDIF